MDKEGKEVRVDKERPLALSLRFLHIMMENLHYRAAKNWKTFNYYLETILAFGINGSEAFEKIEQEDGQGYSKDSEAYKIGMGLYFKRNMLEIMGDFVLGEASPINKEQPRVEMGTTWKAAEFGSVMKLITVMMTDEELQAKYPFSENTMRIVSHKDILSKMMSLSDSKKQNDFGGILTKMCTDNKKLSKKMSKEYVKAVNKMSQDALLATLP
jgi:hypothetical protein